MADVPQILAPEVGADLETLQTSAALQRHQEWVSQPAEDIPKLLKDAGFALVGEVIRANEGASQAYVATATLGGEAQLVVAYRGSGGDDISETFKNSLADADVLRVRPKEIVLGRRGRRVKVHQGFYKDYLGLRDKVNAAVAKAPDAHVYCTGFSLGSALATLTALDLAMNQLRGVTLQVAGTPRVGNEAFQDLISRHVPDTLRLVFTLDVVPRAPLFWCAAEGFMHVGGLLELQADGSPTPAKSIDGRLLGAPEHFKDHDRDKYRDAIGGLIKRFEADPSVLTEAYGRRPLEKAARLEQRSLKLFAR